MENDPKTDLAIAGGAMVSALIDLMVERGDLTRNEVLTVLAEAQKRCVDLKSNGAALVCGRLHNRFKGN